MQVEKNLLDYLWSAANRDDYWDELSVSGHGVHPGENSLHSASLIPDFILLQIRCNKADISVLLEDNI